MIQFAISSTYSSCKARNVEVCGPIFPAAFEYTSTPSLLVGDPSEGDGEPSTSLQWGVLLLYEEFSESDFVQEWHELQSFGDHLGVVLAQPPPFDREGLYQADGVEL